MLGKYAESDDGIHWRKPNLGLINFRGSKENNVVLTGRRAAEQTDGALTNFDGYTILRDDREVNPNRRYKMVAHGESVHFWDNHPVSGSLGRPQAYIDRCAAARGEYITYSPDGLRWEQPQERLDSLPTAGGDRLLVVPDHRHDGFAGLQAVDERTEGELTTKPLKLNGNRLSLNVEQRDGDGSVRVALLDDNRNELPGFGFSASIPITVDAVRAPVRWRTKTDLGSLAGQTVRVALWIRGKAIVYAVAFGGLPKP
jgi:hypothetical protein